MGTHPQKSESASRSIRWARAVPAWLARWNPSSRLQPTDPGKELRFTRSAQAVHFAAAAMVCASAVFALLTLGFWPWHADGSPYLSAWWPGLLPVPMLLGFLWLAVYCSSHAMMILSPVGIEIFPLWFPTKNFRLIPWAQIGGVRAENGRLIVDFHPVGQGGGVVVDLGPLRLPQRELLMRAIGQRVPALV